MKFASCRVSDNGFFVDLFSKDYNKTTFEKGEFLERDAAMELFRECDYIDSYLLAGKCSIFPEIIRRLNTLI